MPSCTALSAAVSPSASAARIACACSAKRGPLKRSRKAYSAERLGWMKPTAWLLNFGRGHLIKDADLIAAVKARKIAGAILDVFRQEPLPAEHPFWSTEGILVLPHIGGPHPQRDRFVAKLFVDNLGRFLDGKPLKETVDRAAGY